VLLGPEDLLHLRSAPVRGAVAASAAAEANGVDGEERGFGCVGSWGSFRICDVDRGSAVKTRLRPF
jgi:hypothetical protein